MSAWLTMLRKDLRLLKNQWLGFLAVAVVSAGADLAAHALGIVDARTALIVGIVLTCTPLIAFPAQAYRGINQEMKEAAALWLQTPQSGWAMLGSKLVSSLIGSLPWLVICYGLALALFRSVNIADALPLLHYQTQVHSSGLTVTTRTATALASLTQSHIAILLAQIPRIELYVMLLFLCYGVYLAMWIALVYMAVQMLKNRAPRLGWIVALFGSLAATWGLGALKGTALYNQLFGWGRVPGVKLFPADVRSLLAGYVSPTLAIGHFTFSAVIVVLLFWITGLIIDRHLEV